MNRKDVLAAAGDARTQLVGDLRSLAPAQWDVPTLCEGWRVRDVVGHLIRLDGYYRRVDRFILGMVRSAGLNRFMSRDALRWAAGRSAEELLEAFDATRYEMRIVQRYNAVTTAFPLTELVVHGQDIRRPLGIEPRLPREQLVAVADHLRRSYLRPWGSSANVRGVRFVATDADWSMGEGSEARGPLESIVMTIAGRSAAIADLSGDGHHLLASRDLA